MLSPIPGIQQIPNSSIEGVSQTSLASLVSSAWFVCEEEKIGDIADSLAQVPDILCCAVLSKDFNVIGKLDRETFFSKLSRNFARDIYSKRYITELMGETKVYKNTLEIQEITDEMSQQAKNPQLQHFILVDENKKYAGMFSSADLLSFLKNKVGEQAMKLAEKNKEILEIARSLQVSLLPKEPTLKGFSLTPYMRTAEEVGGDYYDVLRNGSQEWILIGDVSGHGIPASLVMMMTQTALHTVIHLHPELKTDEIMIKVNHIITSNLRTMGMSKYMTGTLFHHDGQGQLTFAGMHQDLLIYRSKSKKVEVLETNGSWIGYADLMNDFPLNTITLASGDFLFLFTDGITEGRVQDGQQFDLTGLISILEEYGDQDPLKLKKALLNKLDKLEIDDDVTFMIVKKEDKEQ